MVRRTENQQFEQDYNGFMVRAHEDSNRPRTIPITAFFNLDPVERERKSLLDRFPPRSEAAVKLDFAVRLKPIMHRYRAITVAPRFTVGEDWYETTLILRRIMANTCDRYLMIPACNEGEHIHYHGIATFTRKDSQLKFKRLCQKYLGFVCIKLITNAVEWEKYVFDEHQLMQRMEEYEDVKTWTKFEVSDYHRLYIQVDEDGE